MNKNFSIAIIIKIINFKMFQFTLNEIEIEDLWKIDFIICLKIKILNIKNKLFEIIKIKFEI